jgi:hypothetical protein
MLKKDKHEALEELYEELRGMAGEYSIPVWTASQAGRSALEEDVIEADKIASSYGKVMVADFLMSLSRKVEDKMSGTGTRTCYQESFWSRWYYLT